MTSPKARPTLPSATGCETGRSRGAGEKRKRDGRRVARGVREIFARSGWAGEARSATRGGGDATGHRRGSAETESRVKRTAVASTRRGTRRSVAIAAVSLIRAGTRLGGCRRASPRRPPGDPTPRERGKSRGDAPSRLSRDFARTLPVGRAARAHVPVARRRLARPRRVSAECYVRKSRSLAAPQDSAFPSGFSWNQVACGALRCTRYLLVRFFMTTFTYWNT